MKKIALVTGANRGIGFEVCRQLAERGYQVLLAARDASKAREAAAKIGKDVESLVLNVTDADSIQRCAAAVQSKFNHLDALVNNAGIHYDTSQTVQNADWRIIDEAFDTNVFGAWRVVQAFLPLLKKSLSARIVNVSSEAGSLASMGAGTPAYATSKAALNAFTRVLAGELQNTKILVNAVCPGWTRTDMGGAGGRPVSQGAASVVWAVELPDEGPRGGFFRDGKAVPW
jgi:NAD(P)-dependent dehydrogenase (short-subunit alcohol dehydrogenase family)